MFGWMERKATAMLTREMESFVRSLSGMDGDEIGGLLSVATDQRHLYANTGYDLLDPIPLVLAKADVVFLIRKTITELQKRERLEEAGAMMIWLHTVRAASAPELRIIGRRMWKELSRGFPHVERMAPFFAARIRPSGYLELEGYDQVPIGLKPEVN